MRLQHTKHRRVDVAGVTVTSQVRNKQHICNSSNRKREINMNMSTRTHGTTASRDSLAHCPRTRTARQLQFHKQAGEHRAERRPHFGGGAVVLQHYERGLARATLAQSLDGISDGEQKRCHHKVGLDEILPPLPTNAAQLRTKKKKNKNKTKRTKQTVNARSQCERVR
jgi:hypothetical protein